MSRTSLTALSVGVVLAAGSSLVAQAGTAAPHVSASTQHRQAEPSDACQPEPPAGFTSHDVDVDGTSMHYLIGGSGPTLVLVHGYPQTSYEWYSVMPALAEHYTVVVPDLPGAGQSGAPRSGYDKVSMAKSIHGMLSAAGHDTNVRMVGHDIGTMVAYAYAATYRSSVERLMLTEAPIPDKVVYSYPSLTPQGPGFWNFGFFSLTNGLPEQTIDQHESEWVAGFVDWLTVDKEAFTREDTDVYACFLRADAHLRASFEWFRAFPRDNTQVARMGRRPLAMPVLAVGADHSLASSVGTQARSYARDVTTRVVKSSGHWIWEEQPRAMTRMTLRFMR